jgi:Flp pilus assembly protein TadD
MLVLKEACCRESNSPRLWTLYGVQCVRAGRRAEAEHALKQALWLRRRDRDAARVRVMTVLLGQLESDDNSFPVQAA